MFGVDAARLIYAFGKGREAIRGVAASLQGGKFGHGFFSAGVGKGLGGKFLPGGSELTTGEVVYGTVVSAMIGGTASVVAGGKFANGAQSGAMQYLVNQAGDIWNQKNVRGIYVDEFPVGAPYLDYYNEGEWQLYDINDLDITDLIPYKRIAATIRFVTASVDEIRAVTIGEYQYFGGYKYDALYDMENGRKVNIRLYYGTQRSIAPVRRQTDNHITHKFERRTCSLWGNVCW